MIAEGSAGMAGRVLQGTDGETIGTGLHQTAIQFKTMGMGQSLERIDSG